MYYRPAPDREPLTPSERLIYTVLLVGILGLFAADVVHDYHPIKLTALFIILSWIPLLVLHEAAHALVAAMFGWHVARVVIGMGRTVGRFYVGRTLVEIRLFPVEGFVQPVPNNLRAPQLKNALIYFAGPGSELLLLGLLCFFIPPATLLTRSEAIGMLAAQSLAVAVLFSVFCNLVPHYIFAPQGPIPNDGLGILKSFTLPDSYFAAQIGQTFEEPEDDWQVPGRPDW